MNNQGQVENIPLSFPTWKHNPSLYKLPPFAKNKIVLPGVDEEESFAPAQDSGYEINDPSLEDLEMELQRIPGPLRKTIRYIHSGISPKISQGVIFVTPRAGDLHHIVKRSYIRNGLPYVIANLPFNGAVRQTFLEMCRDVSDLNLLINIIPLDYAFHHTYVEERPYHHTVDLKLAEDKHCFTLPEILMAFNIFNLNARLSYLESFIENGLEQNLLTVHQLEYGEENDSNRLLLKTESTHVRAWQRMLLELHRIPIVAEEIQRDHVELFLLWQKAVGNLAYVLTPSMYYEQ